MREVKIGEIRGNSRRGRKLCERQLRVMRRLGERRGEIVREMRGRVLGEMIKGIVGEIRESKGYVAENKGVESR